MAGVFVLFAGSLDRLLLERMEGEVLLHFGWNGELGHVRLLLIENEPAAVGAAEGSGHNDPSTENRHA